MAGHFFLSIAFPDIEFGTNTVLYEDSLDHAIELINQSLKDNAQIFDCVYALDKDVVLGSGRSVCKLQAEKERSAEDFDLLLGYLRETFPAWTIQRFTPLTSSLFQSLSSAIQEVAKVPDVRPMRRDVDLVKSAVDDPRQGPVDDRAFNDIDAATQYPPQTHVYYYLTLGGHDLARQKKLDSLQRKGGILEGCLTLVTSRIERNARGVIKSIPLNPPFVVLRCDLDLLIFREVLEEIGFKFHEWTLVQLKTRPGGQLQRAAWTINALYPVFFNEVIQPLFDRDFSSLLKDGLLENGNHPLAGALARFHRTLRPVSNIESYPEFLYNSKEVEDKLRFMLAYFACRLIFFGMSVPEPQHEFKGLEIAKMKELWSLLSRHPYLKIRASDQRLFLQECIMRGLETSWIKEQLPELPSLYDGGEIDRLLSKIGIEEGGVFDEDPSDKSSHRLDFSPGKGWAFLEAPKASAPVKFPSRVSVAIEEVVSIFAKHGIDLSQPGSVRGGAGAGASSGRWPGSTPEGPS